MRGFVLPEVKVFFRENKARCNHSFSVFSFKTLRDCSFFLKILPPGNLKPQDKHLQTRVEYLIKLLKQAALEDKAEQLRKVIYVSLGYGLSLLYCEHSFFPLKNA